MRLDGLFVWILRKEDTLLRCFWKNRSAGRGDRWKRFLGRLRVVLDDWHHARENSFTLSLAMTLRRTSGSSPW